MPRVEIIVNSQCGSFVEGETRDRIEEALAAAGVDAIVTLAAGDEILRKARESTADVLGAAGGDGTINSVASVAIEVGKPLAILPLGTLNHFSRDVFIPADLDEAALAISSGRETSVDVGEVNGRIFLNNSSIGLYPHIVHNRERQQERLGRGKWIAAFSAAVQMFRRHPFFRVRMELDREARVYRTPFVFVGNNEYSMDLYNIGTRERVDSGKLSVYFLRRGGRWGVIRLLLRTLIGNLGSMKEFEQLTTDSLAIDMRRDRVMVAFDGEVAVMETPLNYRIRPGALHVIVPQEVNE